MPQFRRSLVCILTTLAALAAPAAVRADGPPRLVVFISIDQMRGDYITTYGAQWSHGLKRLTEDGALFMQGAYPYAHTVTCAGHATMSTGTFPLTHGMIGNEWYDRQTGKRITCTDDDSVTPVSFGKPVTGVGSSAKRLLVPTFSDELRAGAPRPPKIVSLSMKPRSAIDLAGHQGDIVIWYSPGTGWLSSSAYGEKSPLIEKFIAANPMEREFTQTWTKMLPEKAYLYADDGLAEFPYKGWTNLFPHPITTSADDTQKSERWEITPFADAYLARMGIAALQEMKLGQTPGPGTDYLAISFSGLDRVGHGFGPRSHEVQDLLANLDKTIGQLLDAIDARVGKGNYVVALTGDHGVSPIPEQLVTMGFDAGRISNGTMVKKIEDLLVQKYGTAKADPKSGAKEGKYIVDQSAGYLYFATGVYDRLKADPETLHAVTEIILQTPGIARVLRAEQLRDTIATDDPIVRSARLSYRADRSGDLFIVPKPYWQPGGAGTTHGSPYKYDQRVPVLLFGAGVKPGKYWGPATPADLAPTLAAICQVTMSRPDGRVLSEALADSAAPARSPARPKIGQTGAGASK